MSLDDNHNSVVLACAKVIQCVLSCDMNEYFFDVSEVKFLLMIAITRLSQMILNPTLWHSLLPETGNL